MKRFQDCRSRSLKFHAKSDSRRTRRCAFSIHLGVVGVSVIIICLCIGDQKFLRAFLYQDRLMCFKKNRSKSRTYYIDYDKIQIFTTAKYNYG